MQTQFKRHDKVRLLVDPDPEYIEYYSEERPRIRKGMVGKINVLLPNGQYHVEIIGENDEEIAYVMMGEEYLEKVED
jgi:hypothetical protein